MSSIWIGSGRFFEVPGKPFDFKRQDALNLHIALGVESDVFDRMPDKAWSEGVEVRGPVDHGFVRSIYMRDPNGYVVELNRAAGAGQVFREVAFRRSIAIDRDGAWLTSCSASIGPCCRQGILSIGQGGDRRHAGSGDH